MSIIDHPSFNRSRLVEVTSVPGDGPSREDRSGIRSPEDTTDADSQVRRDSAGEPSPARFLVVRPWWDPDLAVRGHRLEDPYVEMFWLGVLGPSAVCVLRRFSRGFEMHPGGFRLSVRDTARAIGIGTGTGRNGPLNRTLDRICTFHLARRTALDEIEVRLHLPSLTGRQLSRLPLSVQNAHEDWIARHGRAPVPHHDPGRSKAAPPAA